MAADWIIKSPGIPKKAEMIQKIKAKGIRLSSEIEFGAEFTDAKIIAITGSNGKTTTTSMIAYLLERAVASGNPTQQAIAEGAIPQQIPVAADRRLIT